MVPVAGPVSAVVEPERGDKDEREAKSREEKLCLCVCVCVWGVLGGLGVSMCVSVYDVGVYVGVCAWYVCVWYVGVCMVCVCV